MNVNDNELRQAIALVDAYRLRDRTAFDAVVKQCGTDRGQIIDRASAFAIGMLHELLDKEEQTAQTEAQAEKQA